MTSNMVSVKKRSCETQFSVLVVDLDRSNSGAKGNIQT